MPHYYSEQTPEKFCQMLPSPEHRLWFENVLAARLLACFLSTLLSQVKMLQRMCAGDQPPLPEEVWVRNWPLLPSLLPVALHSKLVIIMSMAHNHLTYTLSEDEDRDGCYPGSESLQSDG